MGEDGSPDLARTRSRFPRLAKRPNRKYPDDPGWDHFLSEARFCRRRSSGGSRDSFWRRFCRRHWHRLSDSWRARSRLFGLAKRITYRACHPSLKRISAPLTHCSCAAQPGRIVKILAGPNRWLRPFPITTGAPMIRISCRVLSDDLSIGHLNRDRFVGGWGNVVECLIASSPVCHVVP